MEKVVTIEGKKFGLKASAGTVRHYRDMFHRDFIVDMGNIEKEILENKTMNPDTSLIAENAIWLMAREYNPELPDIEEWLDQFSPYFTFVAIVSVIEMWHENVAQMNKSKKKI